jgi:hypothetical protein
MHRDVDQVLYSILKSVEDQPVDETTAGRPRNWDWADAATVCRYIYRYKQCYSCRGMRAIRGTSFSHNYYKGCIDVNLVRLLDMLQPHTHTEIKVNIYRAVGRKLPRELTDIVFQWPLTAEEITQDPWLFKGQADVPIPCDGSWVNSAPP